MSIRFPEGAEVRTSPKKLSELPLHRNLMCGDKLFAGHSKALHIVRIL